MRDLAELTDRTAGTNYRYPSPQVALRFAMGLELIRQSGKSVVLTRRGELFLKSSATSLHDLSLDQGKLILGIMLDEVEIRRRVGTLIAKFGTGPHDRLQAHAAIVGDSSEDQRTAIFLQQVGALGYQDGMLFVQVGFEEILPLDVIGLARLDEETLWKRLEAQRLRAKAAEEFVLEFEKIRLGKLGRQDLAELVVRIGAVDVSAGYDIKSFEGDGSPRRVEVKSSTGSKIRFEWSSLERAKAAESRTSYWVYFVPLAHTLPNLSEPPMLIQDPVAKIVSGRLRETASSFIVDVASHDSL